MGTSGPLWMPVRVRDEPCVSLGLALYMAVVPSAERSTRPSQMHSAHGTVSSKMVEPASAPTPTASCF